MELQFVQDEIRVEQPVGSNASQVLVEGDIVISDQKPDIERILDVEGWITVHSQEVVQDRILLEGAISLNILYVPEGGKLSSAQAVTHYTHAIDLVGVRPRMNAAITQQIQHIDYQMQNCRKLTVQAVVDVQASVMDETQLPVLRDVEGGGVQVLRKPVSSRLCVARQRVPASVQEEIVLGLDQPPVTETLLEDAKLLLRERRMEEGRAILSGDVYLTLLYSSGDTLQPLVRSFPFEQEVLVPELSPGMETETRLELDELGISIRENEDGERRNLDVLVNMIAEVAVFDMVESNVVADAYSPHALLQMTTGKIACRLPMGDMRTQTTIKENLPLSGAPLARVLRVTAKPVLLEQQEFEGRLNIAGIMDTAMLYINDEGQAERYGEEVPFHMDMMLEGMSGCELDVQLDVEQCAATPVTPDEVDIRYVLVVSVKAVQSLEQEVVVSIDGATPYPEENQAGIVVYYVQPGDTLWDVAKRFRTTTESIAKYNDIGAGTVLVPGQRILLYRKYQPELQSEHETPVTLLNVAQEE